MGIGCVHMVVTMIVAMCMVMAVIMMLGGLTLEATQAGAKTVTKLAIFHI